MELILCSDLPNEVIDIITNFIRMINLSRYFYNIDIDLNQFLCAVKVHNCVSAGNFTEDHDFIPNIIVYGEFSSDHASQEIGYDDWSKWVTTYKHPFESHIDTIKLPERYFWKRSMFHEYPKRNLENVKYLRYFNAVSVFGGIVTYSYPILQIQFASVEIKLQDYIKRLYCDKDIMIIN